MLSEGKAEQVQEKNHEKETLNYCFMGQHRAEAGAGSEGYGGHWKPALMHFRWKLEKAS